MPEVSSAFPKLLTPREAAERLCTTAGTLSQWRFRRDKALPFVRLSRRIFYRETDLVKFIDAQVDPGVGEKPAHIRRKRARAAKRRS